jgi:hypothetical protein
MARCVSLQYALVEMPVPQLRGADSRRAFVEHRLPSLGLNDLVRQFSDCRPPILEYSLKWQRPVRSREDRCHNPFDGHKNAPLFCGVYSGQESFSRTCLAWFRRRGVIFS